MTGNEYIQEAEADESEALDSEAPGLPTAAAPSSAADDHNVGEQRTAEADVDERRRAQQRLMHAHMRRCWLKEAVAARVRTTTDAADGA